MTLTPKNGFTLIELLIVISIIAILTATIGGNFMTSRVRARDAERKTSLQHIQKALELYYNDYGRYPGSDSGRIVPHESTDRVHPPNVSYANVIPWGQMFRDNYNTIYMQQLPSDIHAPDYEFMYEVDGENLKYRLYARLENDKDIATDLNSDGVPGDEYDGTPGIGSGTAKQCGAASSAYCNYGIASPNTSMTEAW